MDITLLLGIAGSVVLILAWMIETIENVRKHKLVIHPHFAFLYLLGNGLLTYYAYMLASWVFFWLSVALMLAIIGELCYSLKLKHRRR